VQVLLCGTSSMEMEMRKAELQVKLQMAEQLSNQEKKNLENLLLAHSEVFVLTDEGN